MNVTPASQCIECRIKQSFVAKTIRRTLANQSFADLILVGTAYGPKDTVPKFHRVSLPGRHLWHLTEQALELGKEIVADRDSSFRRFDWNISIIVTSQVKNCGQSSHVTDLRGCIANICQLTDVSLKVLLDKIMVIAAEFLLLRE